MTVTASGNIGQLQTKYAHYANVRVKRSKYMHDKSIALGIFDDTTGEQLMIATVCLTGQTPPAGHVWIKDWSENEGVCDALIQAGVIGPVLDEVPSGFVTATLHELIADLYDESGVPDAN